MSRGARLVRSFVMALSVSLPACAPGGAAPGVPRAELAPVIEPESGPALEARSAGDLADLQGHAAAVEAEVLYLFGVATGFGDRFHPDAAITRAQLAVLLHRALLEDAAFETPLAIGDVATDHWAEASIRTVVALDWLSLDDAGRFHPDGTVTREAMIATTARALGYEAADPTELDRYYFDAHEISPALLAHVANADALGLLANPALLGPDGAWLAPHGRATRGEAAAVVFQAWLQSHDWASLAAPADDRVAFSGGAWGLSCVGGTLYATAGMVSALGAAASTGLVVVDGPLPIGDAAAVSIAVPLAGVSVGSFRLAISNLRECAWGLTRLAGQVLAMAGDLGKQVASGIVNAIAGTSGRMCSDADYDALKAIKCFYCGGADCRDRGLDTGGARSCTNSSGNCSRSAEMGCHEISRRYLRSRHCEAIRGRISNECYGGSDDRHSEEARNVARDAANCLRCWGEYGCRGPIESPAPNQPNPPHLRSSLRYLVPDRAIEVSPCRDAGIEGLCNLHVSSASARVLHGDLVASGDTTGGTVTSDTIRFDCLSWMTEETVVMSAEAGGETHWLEVLFVCRPSERDRCVAQPGHGWCATTGECLRGGESGPAPRPGDDGAATRCADWQTSYEPRCGDAPGQAECSAMAGCAWCDVWTACQAEGVECSRDFWDYLSDSP